jgi:hypothetical protein
MKILEAMERKLGRFAISNLTIYLVCGQTLFLIASFSFPKLLGQIELMPSQVMAGEVWRLLTFVFYPPTQNVFFAAFSLYLLWLMGGALEGYWGEFRYNLYLLVAYLATVAAAWVFPGNVATSLYITGSIFLAFAWLYPDFVIHLFFILPIRIKWLALLTWLGYGYVIIFGDWPGRLLIMAAIANFLLFFGREIFLRVRYASKHMGSQAQQLVKSNKPFHTCTVCGISERSHPQAEFRYCPKCGGDYGYCMEHIANHQHRKAPAKTR